MFPLTKFLLTFHILLFFATAIFCSQTDSGKPDCQGNKKIGALPSPNSEKKEELRQEKNFRKALIPKLNEIVSQIEKNYPALIERFSDRDETKVIQSVVKAFNSGIEYIKAEDMTPQLKKENPEDKKTEPFPAIIVASQKILYIRIDNFNESVVARLTADCESSARLANAPVGVVMDLRDCAGFNFQAAIQSLGLFCSKKELSANCRDIEFHDRVLNLPVIILIGKKTKGAAEIFAVIMSNSRQCLRLGEDSAGCPFIKKRVALKSGDFLMLPVVPEPLKHVPAIAVSSEIRASAYPQIPYKEISENAGSENSDNCLQRALDLLISLNALHKERKKPANEDTETGKLF